MTPASPAEPGTVVFLHAHPDDEAIFTGGTIARLSAAGSRVVVVFATNGDHHPDSPLAARRVQEARAACSLLGVARVEFLGYGDSGLRHDTALAHALCRAPHAEVALRVAEVLMGEQAAALVTYDETGIYGHPDHLAVHHCGAAAAESAGLATVYECTVDREYLHFVETHLVGHAVQSLLGIEVTATNVAPLGVPTVMVSTTVDVRSVSARKRAAMAAHPSQIASESETLTMATDTFDGVYGFEWYVRRGPRGVIDDLAF